MHSKWIIPVFIAGGMMLSACGEGGESEKTDEGLYDLAAQLRSHALVDLTHPFDENIPKGYGLPAMTREPLVHYDEGVGSLGSGGLLHLYSLPGQYGTHVDPPAHFHRGLRMMDDIKLSEMILPLVVIDIHEQAADDPDYQVTMADVRAWEKRHGRIPANSFVALRTDWSKRWPDPEKFINRDADGLGHYPGWSREVLEYLYEDRTIAASGHETTDTDPGVWATKGAFPLETYMLSQDKYQIEMMANLDQVPEKGAMIIATWPRVKNGSGFPARVFAVIPRGKPE